MPTFAETMAADLADTMLNVNEFGETVVYHTAGQAPRSIVAVVDRGRRASTAGEHHRINEETLRLTCKSIAAGIPAPAIGDIIRLTEDDPNECWAFVAVEHRDAQAITMQFTRKLLQRSGFPKGLTQ